MRTRPRIADWLDTPEAVFTSRLNNDTVIDAPAATANWQYLLGAMRSKAPGAWPQDQLELTRHFTSLIFLAVYTMMKQTESAEMRVMERTRDPLDGDIEIPWSEPVVQLLEDPNDEDNWQDLAGSMTQQAGLTGTALLWKPTYNEMQIPGELYVIPTASALPWPPSPVYPMGSYLIQPYYPLIRRLSSAMAA